MDKAFYQTLYQNETLYQIEARPQPAAVAPVVVVAAQPKTTQPPPIVAAPIVAPPAALLPVLNHQVLIVVDEDPERFELDKIYLAKILQAINLNLDGVDLLNIYGSEQLDFRPTLNTKKVHHLISFGVPFLRINLDFMMNVYDPKRIKGVNFLFADRLSVIEPDGTLRRQLWAALKSVFLGK